VVYIYYIDVRGASKIKLKKVNKTRTATVRRVTIFLNISRRPLLICLGALLSSSVQNSEGGGDGKGGDNLLTPAKNLNKVF
jgi:hypothetical protein